MVYCVLPQLQAHQKSKINVIGQPQYFKAGDLLGRGSFGREVLLDLHRDQEVVVDLTSFQLATSDLHSFQPEVLNSFRPELVRSNVFRINYEHAKNVGHPRAVRKGLGSCEMQRICCSSSFTKPMSAKATRNGLESVQNARHLLLHLFQNNCE